MCRHYILTEVLSKARLFESSEWSSHVRLIVGVHEYSTSIQMLTHIQCLCGSTNT